MPDSVIEAYVEISKYGENCVREFREALIVDRFNKRVEDRNGNENYPRERPASANVIETKEKVCYKTEYAVGYL